MEGDKLKVIIQVEKVIVANRTANSFDFMENFMFWHITVIAQRLTASILHCASLLIRYGSRLPENLGTLLKLYPSSHQQYFPLLAIALAFESTVPL